VNLLCSAPINAAAPHQEAAAACGARIAVNWLGPDDACRDESGEFALDRG